jgi:7-dehydrocholesterol reductase
LDDGANWSEGIGNGTIFVPLLFVGAPLLCQLLAYFTSPEYDGPLFFSDLLHRCIEKGSSCPQEIATAALVAQPTLAAWQFLSGFSALALALDAVLPGPVAQGPMTKTGHTPQYIDNGVYHCVAFSAIFMFASNLGGDLTLNLFDFGIMYDLFPGLIAALNIFGFALAAFMYHKGLHYPSTKDAGTNGSLLADFCWGTELYPRVFGVDIKRFVNCRFSMTFWMLAGLSFTFKSYTQRAGLVDQVDWGLVFSAVSQYLYLFKFFLWEIGYLRSIDIIVDRAGETHVESRRMLRLDAC